MLQINFCKTARLFGLCCFLLAPFLGNTQQVLNGKLVDSTTGEAVVNAIIFNNGDPKSSRISDSLGEFAIVLKDNSSNTLSIHHINYLSVNLLVDPLQQGELLIELKPAVYQLNSTLVQAFNNSPSSSYTAPASINYIGATTLQQDQQASLQNAVNQSPGVLMESRGAGGSRRISIRGSGIRSPFAVRNVKLYLDGIPLTNPDGSAPLELIDPFDIGSIEILKGPIGGAYGSTNGGAMFFNTKKALEGVRLQNEISAGDYGFLRNALSLSVKQGSWETRVSGIYQELEGYREQEYNSKRQGNLWLKKQINHKNALKLWYTHYSGKWALPGAINLNDAIEDPQQARAFSVENNTFVSRIRDRVSLQYAHTSRYFNHESSVYIHSTNKSNPYGTSPFFNGTKDETGKGFGARTQANYLITDQEDLQIRLNGSIEVHQDDNEVQEGPNPLSAPPVYDRYINATISQEAFAVLGFRADWKGWAFESGLSANRNAYINEGENMADGFSLDTNITLYSLLPRLGISKNAKKAGVYFMNLSTGNSLPSIFEYVNTETGRFSSALNAEQALNFELGTRNKLSNWLRYEVLVFTNTISNAILPQTLDGDQTIFTNRGEIKQEGLEVQVDLNIPCEKLSWLSSLVYSSNYAYLSSRFAGSAEELGFPTNKLIPGVPVHRWNQQISLNVLDRINFRAAHQWFDQIALNDDNSAFTPSYHLVNLYVAYTFELEKIGLSVDLFGGMNNVLDEFYFDFLQVNAGFGRYYNPAPPRNEFAGIRVNWTIK